MERSRAKSLLKIIVALTIALFLITSADAAFWSASVKSDFASWSVYRQSQNLSFDYFQSVQGTVSPVDYRGRSLSPYHSAYKEVKANDVRLRGRTSALQGNYSSAEGIYLRSDTTEAIRSTTTKEANSPIFVFDFFEDWPVILKSSRRIEYSGKEINDREFAGNNLDFVGSNFRYNKKLSAESNVGMLLKRMNATVLGMQLLKSVTETETVAKDTLISAEFMPSRETRYQIVAHTTGIADMKYRLTDSKYDFKHALYPALSEGEERYVGTYNLSRSIHIESDFEMSDFENSTPDDWLPCCFAGWSDMNPLDKRDSGVSAKEIFDCSCGKFPAIE